MIEKIKYFLGNSILWFVAAAGAIFYFWKKEKDIETELAETKASSEVTKDEQKISDADASASAEYDHYESLRRQYEGDLSPSTGQLQQGSSTTTSTDPNKR